jgi:UPF0042 nucleotide-binding protein
MKVVLISGLSGSGKSVALNGLEDQGFFCIDNLPPDFLPDLVSRLDHQGLHDVAVAIDARMGGLLGSLPSYMDTLKNLGHDVRLLFFDADDEVIIMRYSESRRKHPAQAQLGGNATLEECVRHERETLQTVESLGDRIDTSGLQPNTLRHWITETVNARASKVTLILESFGFKRRTPTDADLVFDARCLPNPYYDKLLRPFNGQDTVIQEYFGKLPVAGEFIDDVELFIRKWLPRYQFEQRSYLTVAIGCTGGQHRSVYVVEQLARRFRDNSPDIVQAALIRHRVIHTNG